MKKLSLSLLTLFIALLSVQLAHAQLFEDFEGGVKGGYAGAAVELGTGFWYFDDALLDGATNDKFNGSKGVRMDRRFDQKANRWKRGSIYMLFDKPDGAQDLTFSFANYGNSSGNTLQVQYSTDQGSSWTNLGEELTATSTLEAKTLAVNVEGNIRFKFIHASGEDRLNLDDVLISDFITPEAEATIIVSADGLKKDSGTTVSFPSTLVGTNRTISLSIMNSGTPDLTLSSVNVTGRAFSIDGLSDSTLAFSESTNLTVTYEPTVAGNEQGTIEITSNAINYPTYTLNLEGEATEDGEIITIAEARALPLGSRVSVTGRVTVANELDGPVYMQDATAGIAIYYPALHNMVTIGDSVTISGPLGVFRPIAGDDADFLLQITETDTDKDLSFKIIDTENKKVVPKVVTSSGVNSGSFDSQLVQIDGVTFGTTGTFMQESDYELNDALGSFSLRIDKDTNIPNAEIPIGEVNIIGIVSKFAGNYQVIPRFTSDIGVEEKVYPADDIDKSLTLDVATWNIEWFGDSGLGPTDNELQLDNVLNVIRTMDMDLYALSEISNVSMFNRLVDSLDTYGGLIADFSQTQKTAFLFKRAVIDSLDSRLLQVPDGMTSYNWANGRMPLEFRFNATINDEIREIYAYAIHAKAMPDQTSYTRKVGASAEIKNYFDTKRNSDNVMLLGDYNDYVTKSMTTGNESPYKNFVDDVNYLVITKTLEEAGLGSHSGGSMIDHIMINKGLFEEYIEGTERIETVSYVGSFKSTTSDHYPVWTRFTYGNITSNEPGFSDSRPTSITLKQNYPNPFNPSTVISYTLNKGADVKLQVFDITGRDVATLVNKVETEGEKNVTFDASALSSGLYFYRLTTSEGTSITKKMMLIK